MSANQSCAGSPGKARKWELALSELLEAHYYATDLGRPVGEFAVELARLAEAGLTNNDLRWLFAKGLVEQTTKVGGVGRRRNRTVRAAAAISFSPRTRIALTKAGLAFASELYPAPSVPGHFSPSPLMGEGRGEGALPTGTVLRSPSPLTGEGRGEGVLPSTQSEDTSALLPRWDSGTRTLRLGSTLVKQFKVPASTRSLSYLPSTKRAGPPQSTTRFLRPRASNPSAVFTTRSIGLTVATTAR